MTIWLAAGQYFWKTKWPAAWNSCSYAHLWFVGTKWFFLPQAIVDHCRQMWTLCWLINTWTSLNVRHVNNTQRGLSIFIKTKYWFYFCLHTLKLRGLIQMSIFSCQTQNQFLSCNTAHCIVIMSNRIFTSRSENVLSFHWLNIYWLTVFGHQRSFHLSI